LQEKAVIVKTESGTVYDLSNGFCVRNGQFEFKFWWSYCFEEVEGMGFDEIPSPFDDKDADKRLPLQVGKRMYLGGKDGWMVSTKILSIREGLPNE